MDVSLINSLISSVGFPIACVLGLGWFIYKAFEKFTAQSEKREDKLYNFITEAQTTNEKLVETNSEFVEILDAYKTDLNEIREDISDIKERIK